MKMIHKKNKMLYPLLIAVLIIWGIIMYRVIDHFTSKEEDEQIINDFVNIPERINTRVSDQNDTVSFISLSRDPFLFPVEVKKVQPDTTRKKENLVIIEEPMFNYSIDGIIINSENQKTVIIEDLDNNTTLYLHEGESYRTIKIKSIEVNQLTLIEKGEIKNIKVE